MVASPFFAQDGKWHDTAARFLLGAVNGTMPRIVFHPGQ